MGKEIPNLLWLTNPVNTSMLMFKSFFPPSGEGESSSSPPPKDTLKGEVKGKTPPLPKSNKDESKSKIPRGLPGPVGLTFGGKGGSTYDNRIKSVSKKASYEKHHHQIVTVPVVVKTGGLTQSTSTKLVGSASGGGGDDPYEVLDFQG